MTSKLFNRRCIGMIVTKKCHGDCCGPLIMSPVNFDDLSHRARSGYEFKPVGSGLNLYTIDGHDCPFLSKESRRCRIYSKRLKICRKFGDESHELMCCPHISKNGKIRSEKLVVDFSDLKKRLLAELR